MFEVRNLELGKVLNGTSQSVLPAQALTQKPHDTEDMMMMKQRRRRERRKKERRLKVKWYQGQPEQVSHKNNLPRVREKHETRNGLRMAAPYTHQPVLPSGH